MRLAAPLSLAVLLSLAACGPPAPTLTPEQQVAALNSAIDALAARPEDGTSEVTVQHLLVGVVGNLPGVTRPGGDAERLTAELYLRAKDGEDFDDLVREYTDDTHPGIYRMITSGKSDEARGTLLRSEMVKGFGDVAWRLAVGEIGVVPYDPPPQFGGGTSPFGFHIVKRLR
jgi:hypothetical protein